MKILLALITTAFTGLAAPSTGGLLEILSPANSKASSTISAPVQIALTLTLLTLLPAIIMSVTPFLRIVTVLHFLRQALGTQSAPSNQILLGLSMFLAALIMQPVTTEIYEKAWLPYEQGTLSAREAAAIGIQPLKVFMTKFAKEKEVALFLEMTKSTPPKNRSEVSFSVLVPAYILSELKVAFQIGAVLFLPFLVIDLVVASVTLSIGMIQLPPVMVSAPFKILLFVLVDGWTLVLGSLLKSFYV